MKICFRITSFRYFRTPVGRIFLSLLPVRKLGIIYSNLIYRLLRFIFIPHLHITIVSYDAEGSVRSTCIFIFANANLNRSFCGKLFEYILRSSELCIIPNCFDLFHENTHISMRKHLFKSIQITMHVKVLDEMCFDETSELFKFVM